jgi:DNA transformation protein
MTHSDFVTNVLDLLQPWGGVSARRMFGGHGLYRQGVMFALISDDVLYLKVDSSTRPAFEWAGMGPFAYDAKARSVTIRSYYEAPPDLFDDADLMRLWAGKALDTALRARQARPEKRKNEHSGGFAASLMSALRS